MELSKIPVSGFEFDRCHAHEAHKRRFIDKHQRRIPVERAKLTTYQRLYGSLENFNTSHADLLSKIESKRVIDPVIKKDLHKARAIHLKIMTSQGIVDGSLPLDGYIPAQYGQENLAKVFGYVPLLGIVIGVCRIARAILDKTFDENPNLNSGRQIFRGFVEIIGLGFFYLPIDIGVTIYRSKKYSEG